MSAAPGAHGAVALLLRGAHAAGDRTRARPLGVTHLADPRRGIGKAAYAAEVCVGLGKGLSLPGSPTSEVWSRGFVLFQRRCHVVVSHSSSGTRGMASGLVVRLPDSRTPQAVGRSISSNSGNSCCSFLSFPFWSRACSRAPTRWRRRTRH